MSITLFIALLLCFYLTVNRVFIVLFLCVMVYSEINIQAEEFEELVYHGVDESDELAPE